MNRISEITRKNIFDYIQLEGFFYHGRLGEQEFLSRLYDLEKLPSHDSRFDNASGDIWQHRINNPQDWEDNWIYSDERFGLLKGDDTVFLQFLCEMIHPLVRLHNTDVNRLLTIFNEQLKTDGYEIVEKARISERPIFIARQKIAGQQSLQTKSRDLSQILNAEYVTQQIHLMEASIENAPHVAIGTAKELIETCCKKILIELHQSVDRNWDLIQLLKQTNKQLRLTPEDINDEVQAAKTIRSILGSLATVVHGICELRNSYGSGHGKEAQFRGLGPRHARLAVGAATTLAIFLLETHDIRSNKGSSNDN